MPVVGDQPRAVYENFCNGFGSQANRPPFWKDLEPWIRDAITVAYLQGKLDGKSETRK